MAIKSDKWIKNMSLTSQMISPFEDKQVSKSKISYGLSSYCKENGLLNLIPFSHPLADYH